MPLIAVQPAPNDALGYLGATRPKCLNKWRGKCVDPAAFQPYRPTGLAPIPTQEGDYMPALPPITGGSPVLRPAAGVNEAAVLKQGIASGMISRDRLGRYFDRNGRQISQAAAIALVSGRSQPRPGSARPGQILYGLSETVEEARQRILSKQQQARAQRRTRAQPRSDSRWRGSTVYETAAVPSTMFGLAADANYPAQDPAIQKFIQPSTGGSVGSDVAKALTAVASAGTTTWLALEQMKAQERINKAALQAQLKAQQQGQRPGTDWTTIALVGGGVALAGAVIYAIAKRRKK